MQLYRILKLGFASAGMLVLAAGASACAVDAEEAIEEPGSEPEVSNDESVSSAEEEIHFYRRRVPHLAGLRFRTSYDPRIFLIDHWGRRRWIPDVWTYNNLFRGWDDIATADWLGDIAWGPHFGRGAFLASPWGRRDLFLIDGGRRHWIRSPYIMDRYRFAWPRVRRLHPRYFDRLAWGHPWW